MTSDQPDLFGHNRSPLLIGLWSPAMGSGKTEVADRLSRAHGFRHMSMAHSLKAMFIAFLVSCGMEEDEARACAYDAERKEQPLDILQGKTPRHAMQTLGTEWGRECLDPNVWCRSGMARAQACLERGHSVVFDDVRFPNEAQAIEEAGGFMISIERPSASITHEHPSEGALMGWCFAATILNQGTLEQLAEGVDRLVDVLRTVNL